MIDIAKNIGLVAKTDYFKIMQFPEELIQFIQFMIDNDIRSYLEIGVKAGHLIRFLGDLLPFNKIMACDINYPKIFKEYKKVEFYYGSSHSEGYHKWRKSLGMIDMVLIDASHKYKDTKNDYLRERDLPHHFLAFHDICNIGYPELSRFWRDEVTGEKVEFVNDNPKDRLICLRDKDARYMKNYRRKYGTNCGIGICWKKH